MGKKLRLNVESLKVTSFVTSLKNEQQEEVKGGASPWTKCSVPWLCTEETCLPATCGCPTTPYTCAPCTYDSCAASCSCDTRCP